MTNKSCTTNLLVALEEGWRLTGWQCRCLLNITHLFKQGLNIIYLFKQGLDIIHLFKRGLNIIHLFKHYLPLQAGAKHYLGAGAQHYPPLQTWAEHNPTLSTGAGHYLPIVWKGRKCWSNSGSLTGYQCRILQNTEHSWVAESSYVHLVGYPQPIQWWHLPPSPPRDVLDYAEPIFSWGLVWLYSCNLVIFLFEQRLNSSAGS